MATRLCVTTDPVSFVGLLAAGLTGATLSLTGADQVFLPLRPLFQKIGIAGTGVVLKELATKGLKVMPGIDALDVQFSPAIRSALQQIACPIPFTSFKQRFRLP